MLKAAHRFFKGCLQLCRLQLVPCEPPKSTVIGCPRQLEIRAQTVGKLKHFLSGAIVQTKVLLKRYSLSNRQASS